MKNSLHLSFHLLQGHRACFLFILLFSSLLINPARGQNAFDEIFLINDTVILISVNRQADGKLKADLSFANGEKPDVKKSFVFFTNSYEVFQKSFETTVLGLFPNAIETTKKDIKTKLSYLADQIYKKIVLYEYSSGEKAPKAGTIIFSRNAKVVTNYDEDIPCKKRKRIEKLITVVDSSIKRLHTLDSSIRAIDSIGTYNLLIKDSLNKKIEEKKALQTKLKNKKEFRKRTHRSQVKQYILDVYTDIQIADIQIDSARKWIALLTGKDKLVTAIDTIKKHLTEGISQQLLALSDAIDTFFNKNPMQRSKFIVNRSSYIEALTNNQIAMEKCKNWNRMAKEDLIGEIPAIADMVRKEEKTLSDLQQILASSIDTLVSVKQGIDGRKGELSAERDSVISLLGLLRIVNTENFSKKEKDSIGGLIKNNESVQRKLERQIADVDSASEKNNKTRIHFLELNTLIAKKINPVVNKFLDTTLRNFITKQKEIEKREKELGNLVQREKNFFTPKLFQADSVTLEFNDGVLKNVIVVGKYRNERKMFENKRPIQFTGLTHIEKISRVDLFSDNDQREKIRLYEIFKYVPQLHVDAEDYCPSDSVYTIDLTRSNSEIVRQALKEKASKILEAKSFTDLLGFSAEQPNGLIQFEVTKRIPLFTMRHPTSKKNRSFCSFGTYYEPSFTLSKIEQNNKYFYPVTTVDVTSKLAISTIDVYKHSSLKVKALNLNVFNFEFAEAKLAIEINGGFSILYTPVKDTVSVPGKTQQWGAVSGLTSSELRFVIKPDSQYGASLSGNIGWLFLWDEKMKLINDPQNPTEPSSYNRKLLTFQFDAFFKPFGNSETATFLRVANVHSFPMSQTYLQVQVGFAFSVLGRSKTSK